MHDSALRLSTHKHTPLCIHYGLWGKSKEYLYISITQNIHFRCQGNKFRRGTEKHRSFLRRRHPAAGRLVSVVTVTLDVGAWGWPSGTCRVPPPSRGGGGLGRAEGGVVLGEMSLRGRGRHRGTQDGGGSREDRGAGEGAQGSGDWQGRDTSDHAG